MALLKVLKRSSTLDLSLTDSNTESLMTLLLKAGVPVSSSCGGDGVCAKCVITINEGQSFLPPPSQNEAFLAQKLGWSANQRLSCQCYPQNSLTVSCPYW